MRFSVLLYCVVLISVFNYTKAYDEVTNKPLSLSANLHIFLLKLIGKYDVLNVQNSKEFHENDDYIWTTNPSTYSSVTTTTERTTTTRRTTTTPEPPYKLMMQIPKQFENGTYGIALIEPPEALLDIHKMIDEMTNKYRRRSTTISPFFVKVYLTSTEKIKTSTENEILTTGKMIDD